MSVAMERSLAESEVPTRRQYAHAPIVEAVLDIKVALPAGVIEDLRSVHGAELGQYAELREAYDVQAGMEIDVQGVRSSTSASKALSGYMLVDNVRKQAAQLNIRGFSYSKYEPYDRWETFVAEARRLWGRYRSILRPKRIERLALRYINRLDLALPVQSLKDYLRTAPDIAPGISHLISGYAMELHMPQPDLPGVIVVMRQASVAPAREGVISIVLDIETVLPNADLSGETDSVWKQFEILHMRENRTFEATITDQIREMIS